MKELTHEEWIKNPTPRLMWVWDDDEKDKVQRKVVYVVKGGPSNLPVRATKNDDADYEAYRHCAEIEKPRRMTSKELSRWLRENPTREYKCRTAEDKDSLVCWYHSYIECCADNEVGDSILIRENDGEWREPLVEVDEFQTKDELKQKEIIKDFTLTAKIEHPKD